MKCKICGEEVVGGVLEMENHWSGHAVRPVKNDPLSYLLVLPDGITEGCYEAAEAFVDAYAELKQSHPDVQFNFFPFSFKSLDNGKNPALASILAIAK